MYIELLFFWDDRGGFDFIFSLSLLFLQPTQRDKKIEIMNKVIKINDNINDIPLGSTKLTGLLLQYTYQLYPSLIGSSWVNHPVALV